jgi:pyridoxal biosynthesis lyase PdxS
MEISSGTFKGSTGEQLAIAVIAKQNWANWEMIGRVDRPLEGKLGI